MSLNARLMPPTDLSYVMRESFDPGFGVDRAAVYDADETHRYMLYRVWSDLLPMVVIGLNPSTATEAVDDPTIRRCVRFARDWGHGGLVMLNLFSLRATNPQALYHAINQSGAGAATGGEVHDRMLLHYTEPERQSRILLAYGNHGGLAGRGKAVVKMLEGRSFEALNVTAMGFPIHPLYQPASSKPMVYGVAK